MKRQRTGRAHTALAVLLTMVAASTGVAQDPGDITQLRASLQERYQIVELQSGVALVPRQPSASVRIIEIRDGSVEVNGETLTGREVRDRLGDDAALVVRVTYLDQAGRQTLLGAASVADISPPEAAAPPVVEIPEQRARVERRVRRGEVVRVGGGVTVPRDERVEGDVVAVFGSARIDGEVNGEVTVVLGSVFLGRDAIVRRDVTIVGGELRRDPGARVDGAVRNIAVGGGDWPRWAWPALLRDSFASRMGNLVATLLRVALLTLVAVVVVAVGRSSIEAVADRTAADPVRAGLVGFAAQLLFVPVLVVTIVVLAVSIIGIPLLALVPFGVLIVGLVLLVGFTGVAYHVGRFLNGRLGWTERGAYVTVMLGVLVIVAITVIARSAAVALGGLAGMPLGALGYFIEYLAWTIGFGAAILVWLRGRNERRRTAMMEGQHTHETA